MKTFNVKNSPNNSLNLEIVEFVGAAKTGYYKFHGTATGTVNIEGEKNNDCK